MERPRGFTLPELMFALAIVVGLLGWAIPSFGEFRRNAERTREVNQFIQAIYLARSEAIKRNGVVSLCPSLDGSSCGPAGTPWHRGWIVFANLDRDSPARRDVGESLLRAYAAWPNGSVHANRGTLSFRPTRQFGVTASFVFCDYRGPDSARAVVISQTGRPRVTGQGPGRTPLKCI